MELMVAASPPRMPAPHQAPSDAKLAQAVTDMVFQVKQTVATTPSVATSHHTSQSNTYAMRDAPRYPQSGVHRGWSLKATNIGQQPFVHHSVNPVPFSRMTCLSF